jgi:hypothetical protein
LRRHLARLVSEKINRLIPKVVGTALIIIGLIVVIVTIVVGKMD